MKRDVIYGILRPSGKACATVVVLNDHASLARPFATFIENTTELEVRDELQQITGMRSDDGVWIVHVRFCCG